MVAGLGNTTVPYGGRDITVDPNGEWVPPWYCKWFSIGLDSCVPPSSIDLAKINDLANMGQTALANPDLVKKVLDAQSQGVIDYCTANPDMCTNCSWYDLICQIKSGNTLGPLMIGGGVLVALMVLRR